MRKYNPKRFTRHNDRCNCEHTNHFKDRYDPVLRETIAQPRMKHPYLRRPAGNAWAMFIGHVCDDCAATCMEGWIVNEHVCGTGDCGRIAQR